MDEACEECSFGLWKPIADMSVSKLGLYSDNRFPGRSILSLNEHFDSLEDVPVNIMNQFMEDSCEAIIALKKATGSPRINFAILGNAVSHVHTHLIPRYPEAEEFPNQSPWNDKRLKESLDSEKESRLIAEIRRELSV